MTDTIWCWNESNSNDPAKASAFYQELFGWSENTMEMGEMGTYRMLNIGERTVAGMMATPEGVPSHWLGYVQVEDVDATAEKIAAAGGNIMMPPFDIPNMGRSAIVTDPQGAAFGLFAGTGDAMSAADAPMANPVEHSVCWVQLMTSDVQGAVKFYQDIFGWSSEPMEDQFVFKVGERMHCSVMANPQPETPNHWLTYVMVDEVSDYETKASKLGGTVLVPKSTVPNMGEFSVIADPTGGVYAVWKDFGSQAQA